MKKITFVIVNRANYGRIKDLLIKFKKINISRLIL